MWTDLLDLPCRLDTTYTGHNEIHEHYIRSKFRRHTHSFFPRTCLTHHIEIGLQLQTCTVPLPHKGVIIGDQLRNCVCHMRSTLSNGSKTELFAFLSSRLADVSLELPPTPL